MVFMYLYRKHNLKRVRRNSYLQAVCDVPTARMTVFLVLIKHISRRHLSLRATMYLQGSTRLCISICGQELQNLFLSGTKSNRCGDNGISLNRVYSVIHTTVKRRAGIFSEAF